MTPPQRLELFHSKLGLFGLFFDFVCRGGKNKRHVSRPLLSHKRQQQQQQRLTFQVRNFVLCRAQALSKIKLGRQRFVQLCSEPGGKARQRIRLEEERG